MLSAVIAHLQAGTPSWGTRVALAEDLEPQDDLYNISTSLYLGLEEDLAGGDGTNNLVSHRLERRVDVYVICSVANLDSVLTELRSTMIGFNPASASGYDDFWFVRGKLMGKKSGVVWWIDTYSTWVTLRQAYGA